MSVAPGIADASSAPWANRHDVTLMRSGPPQCDIVAVLGGHGAWYAGKQLYEHEARETKILTSMVAAAAGGGEPATVAQTVNEYGGLQAQKAVQIAAHSHIIEFGLLAILLSFVQPYVFLSGDWKRIWVRVLLAGSLILPIFVLLELKLGLLAAGIADVGGLMVIVALIGMLAGMLRYTGKLDSEAGGMA